MGIMHLIWTILIGFVTGLCARALLPGADQMGFLATSALGIVGSVVGGFLSRKQAKPAGFFMSFLGAVIILLLWRALR